MSREQVIRQWRLVEALHRRRHGLTLAELIDISGASRATVYRDIDLLEEAGVPLTRERVAGKVRHRLMDSARARFAPESHEIAALVLARQMLGPLEGLRAVEALDDLLRRIARAPGMPPAVGVASAAPGAHRGALRAIDLAIRNGDRLAFEYHPARNDRAERRRVDPMSLRLHRGQPYLVGFDVDRNDWRIFKVARIAGDIALDGTAEPRPEYDEEELFRHSVGVWTGDPLDVVVRMSAAVAARVEEYPLAPGQRIEPTADGSVLIRARVAGIVEPLRWVLGWGAAAEVLEPDELQSAVVDELNQALLNYETINKRKEAVSQR